MKKTLKHSSEADSFSASEAASYLGVSIPTVRRMVESGTLQGFKTPGGHLRVHRESLESLQKARPLHTASPVLQNRREQIEETLLETQALRAKHDLARLQEEQRNEDEQRQAEAKARRQEAADRRAERRLESERLAQEERQDLARERQKREEENRRREAEQQLQEFRCRWREKAARIFYLLQPYWLTAAQAKEILDQLLAVMNSRDPSHEALMPTILESAVHALLEPIKAAHEAENRRQQATREAIRSLPSGATDAENLQAQGAIRESFRSLDNLTDLQTLRIAAQNAVEPLCRTVNKRRTTENALWLVEMKLPRGYTEEERSQFRRDCQKILAALPVDISEAEARSALASITHETSARIERRNTENSRQSRKRELIAAGLKDFPDHLYELYSQNKLAGKSPWDVDLNRKIRAAVQNALESLRGDEAAEDVKAKVRGIVRATVKEMARLERPEQRPQQRSRQW